MSLFKSTAPVPATSPAPRPTVSPWVDRGASLLFDWLVEPAGQQTHLKYTLFAEPMGQNKPIWRTNMQMAEMLPAPSGFVCRSIHCFYGRMTEADQRAFQESYMLSFHINERIFYQSPLIAMPSRGAILPWTKEDVSDGELWEPGHLGKYCKYIPPLSTFWVELIGEPFVTEATGTGLRFLPVLNGYLDRSVSMSTEPAATDAEVVDLTGEPTE